MRTPSSPAFERARRVKRPLARARAFAQRAGTGSHPPSAMRCSLPGALTIALGLVGIHLAHAFEEFVRVRLVHLRRVGAFAAPAARPGPRRSRLLCLVWHNSR